MEYGDTIAHNHQQSHRLAARVRLAGLVSVFVSFVLLGSGGYWVFKHYSLLSFEQQLLIGCTALFVGALVGLMLLLTTIAYRLLHRSAETDLLRFDVYQATKDALSATILRYLPDQKNLVTELVLGEEMVTKLEQVNARYVRLQSALAGQLMDTRLPDIIHQLVKAALAANQATANNKAAATFLEKHDASFEQTQKDGQTEKIRSFPTRES